MPRSTSLASLLGALSLLAALAPACSASTTVVDEAEPPVASAETDMAPADAPTDPPADASAKPADAAASPAPSGSAAAGSAKKAAGASCDTADECASGTCEGEGCGAGQGRCAEADRKCTMDLRQYCGCDGKTFNAGGNCPKQRYAKKGACAGDAGPGPKVPAPKKP